VRSKDKKTSWIAIVNQKRNIVSHPSSGQQISIEELDQLKEIHCWLEGKISGKKVFD